MNCCKHKYFVIYRGDDTDFPGNQELIVELNTERDLTGCSAHFSFQGFTQDFDEIPSDKKLHLIFPSSETKKFALGAADAKLWLTNGTKIRTIENRIHIVVTNRVDEAYNNDDPQAITVTISGGGGGATVVLDDTVTEESPNGVKSSGIWSWVKSLLPQWLTSDYAEPATAASVATKADKATTLAGYGITDALPLIEDFHGDKSAVTIGSRDNYDQVGAASFAQGFSVTPSALASHASGVFSEIPEDDKFAFAWNGNKLIRYKSHGPGTFNINPVGGPDGLFIGEKTLPQVINAAIAGKANLASLALEYSSTSAYSVGAIVYHDGSIYQCKTAIADGGEAWNAEHWELRELEDFFTESNSLLNGRLAYSRNATGLKDRAFNALAFDGTEYNLSTALAAVTPTASGQPRDLLIVATATAATTISFTAGTIKGDKPTIDGSGTWLITLTEYASGVWYCRQIKMEDAA